MVTRHMAKMTHEEYLPRCRVPVITSPEEEQRIISTSAKVRVGRGRGGEGEGWSGACTRVPVTSTSVAVVCFVHSSGVPDAAQSGASKGATESSAVEW